MVQPKWSNVPSSLLIKQEGTFSTDWLGARQVTFSREWLKVVLCPALWSMSRCTISTYLAAMRSVCGPLGVIVV